MSRAALALALAAALTGCASGTRRGPEGRWVEAEGWAPLGSSGRAHARRRAVVDAQRRAVEEGAGVRLSGSTVVENAVGVRQRLRADSDGFVERQEVVAERVEEGILKVRVRAFVRRGESGAFRARPPEDAGSVRLAAGGPAGDGMRRAFVAAGFVEAEATGRARFLVRARSSARAFVDGRLGGFRSSRARVVVEVVEAATGTVVASGTGESSALALEAADAKAQAAETAGETAAGAAAAALSTALWSRL